MIDVKQVTDLHRETVIRWHEQEIDNAFDGVLEVVCKQHSFNFLLWHEEDIARSPTVWDTRVEHTVDVCSNAPGRHIKTA